MIWLKSYIYHILFWLVTYLILLILLSSYLGLQHAFIRTTIVGATALILVYLNMKVLVPYFFDRKKYWKYIFFAFVVLIISTFIRFYIDIWLLPKFPIFFPVKNYELRILFYYWIANQILLYISLAYSLAVNLNKEKIIKSELEKLKLETELKLLKHQINPHFLLNTLNNIYTLSYLNHPQAPSMIMKLSENMKYLLYDCDDQYVALEDEIRFIENYVELNKLRIDNPENISFIYSVANVKQKIYPMLFTALIENAFKHSNTNSEGYVNIELCIKNDNVLYFSCFNTKNQTKSNLNESSGIGLHNVKQRFDILFGNNYIFKIEDRKNSFQVNLTFNLLP